MRIMMRRPAEQALPAPSADLLHRAAGSDVHLPNPENHRVGESESMAEHQPLDFAVCPSAPMPADKEGPANLNFAPLRVITVIAARSDRRVRCAFNEGKRAFAGERAVKELPEDRLLVPV